MTYRTIAVHSTVCEIDGHAAGRVGEQQLRAAVTGDEVVAGEALERIEADEAGRVVSIGEIAAIDAVDAREGVMPDRDVARDRAGAQTDGDAAC
ncbi:hypothetical protein, partial [Bradyrhizobium sp. 23AC]